MIFKLIAIVFLVLYLFGQIAVGQHSGHHIELDKLFVDAADPLYKDVLPGDTILLTPGNRQYLLIKNFQGAPGKPIVLINEGGDVVIDTDHYYGISIQNCRYLHITGSGDKLNFYGFKIKRVKNGSGIGVGSLSSDIEIDHVSIENTAIGGIYAKTDPDCSLTSVRGTFTQFNTIVHDNYFSNTGNESLYIGSTKYTGQNILCDGKEVLLMPSLLDGVTIYNNIIKYAGWDGIQVSSASSNCKIYDNTILFDSQAEYSNQMSGIILGGGSNCDCYNNYIADGKGDGIENHGLGGNRIFNNIIVNAGISYEPNDYSKMKHGIFVSDNSVLPDKSFYIQNNTIVHPKSDGIRFSSTKSKNNLISSNVIINPGNFDVYQNGNTQFKGVDSYVMIPDKSASVLLKNNYFARNSLGSGLETDYSLQKNSPLIDAGYIDQPRIAFDFKYHPRTADNPPDIGAYEYSFVVKKLLPLKDSLALIAYPNPVTDELNIQFHVDKNSDITFSLYNLKGQQIFIQEQSTLTEGSYTTKIDVRNLVSGIYLYSVKTADHLVSGKFIKTNEL